MRKRLAVLISLALMPIAMAHMGDSNGYVYTGVSPNPSCMPTQNPHDYFLTSGFLLITDGNKQDCGYGGGAGEYDGDWELGTGVGRFIIAPGDPDCSPSAEIAHHGKSIDVIDSFVTDVHFLVGANPTPYMKEYDDDGNLICTRSNVIIPDQYPESWLYECTNSCVVPAFVTLHGTLRPTDPGPDGEIWIWVFLDGGATSGHIWSS